MMNILLAGQAYYRRDNGQAVFTINLAEHLVAAGNCVMVLAPSETGQALYALVSAAGLSPATASYPVYNFSGSLSAA